MGQYTPSKDLDTITKEDVKAMKRFYCNMVDETPVLAMGFMKSHQNLKRAKNAYKEAWDEYQSAHNCLFMLDLYTGRDNVADWDRLLPSNAASNEDK